MTFALNRIARRLLAPTARWVSVFGAAAVLASTSGCMEMAETWAHLTGGDWIDPEFELTQLRLLILIDDKTGQVSDPRAIREIHRTLSENFLEFNVNKRVVPLRDWQKLQSRPDYGEMTIREIGEEVGAEQVLYIGIERFTLNTETGAPIFRGEFAARVKVISTERRPDVRLWPKDDEAGRRVVVTTEPTPADSDTSASDVATELGIKMGREIAGFFYGRREFQR